MNSDVHSYVCLQSSELHIFGWKIEINARIDLIHYLGYAYKFERTNTAIQIFGCDSSVEPFKLITADIFSWTQKSFWEWNTVCVYPLISCSAFRRLIAIHWAVWNNCSCVLFNSLRSEWAISHGMRTTNTCVHTITKSTGEYLPVSETRENSHKQP